MIQKKHIDHLSREEKLELFDLIQEKKLRQKRQKARFIPNEGQRPILASLAEERWVTAGNGGGKTTLAVHDAIWAALGYNPIAERYTKVPATVIVVLDAPAKVQDVWLSEINKWFDTSEWEFNKRGKPYISELLLPNGSQIQFMFHEQNEMAFESIEWSHVVFDEPPPRHVYIALKRGGRTKGHESRVLEVGTPIAEAWIRTEVIEPTIKGERPGTEIFKFSTHVNKGNLQEGYIEKFTRVLSDKERQVRLHGEFYDLEGLALAHLFERSRHIVRPFEWPSSWPCVVAIDPAQAKPHVACLLGVNHEGRYFYIKELSLKCSPREFARALKEWYRGYPIVDIVCDSYGSAEQGGGEGMKSFIQVLNDEGVRARPTTYEDKDDEAWIAAVQDVLLLPPEIEDVPPGPPKLRIFAGNDLIVYDIENVQWLKYKNQEMYKPKLDISKKDALACLKYALASNLTFQKKNRPRIHRPANISWRDRRI